MGNDGILKNKRKQRKKLNKYQKLDPTFLKTLPLEIQKDLSLLKYWNVRFRLFKKFNQGIKLDKGKIIFIIVFINNLVYLYIYN